jgi:hypothetical protein
MPGTLRDPRSGDMLDPETQWHRHHAGRAGEVGGWRRILSPAQATTVERRMADWMAASGYAAEPAPVRALGYTLTVAYRVAW